jgi:hypothetical protein
LPLSNSEVPKWMFHHISARHVPPVSGLSLVIIQDTDRLKLPPRLIMLNITFARVSLPSNVHVTKVKQYSILLKKVKGVICHHSTKPSFPVVPSGGNLQCQIADNRQTPVLSLSHHCGSQSPIFFNECETGEPGVIIHVATTSMRDCQRQFDAQKIIFRYRA